MRRASLSLIKKKGERLHWNFLCEAASIMRSNEMRTCVCMKLHFKIVYWQKNSIPCPSFWPCVLVLLKARRNILVTAHLLDSCCVVCFWDWCYSRQYLVPPVVRDVMALWRNRQQAAQFSVSEEVLVCMEPVLRHSC